MEKISVSLKNCYGIRALDHEFNTSKGRAFILYAPNGMMKTSLAKVFNDVSQGQEPKDEIFPHRDTTFSIKDENGVDIPVERILVIQPYQESFASNKTATLMADKELRARYQNLTQTIDEKTNSVMTRLGEAAGLRKGVQHEITYAHGRNEREIHFLLDQMESDLKNEENPGFGDTSYDEVFNSKVLSFLESEDVRLQLEDYVNRYNELIDNSTYFRRGVFNHNNALNVCKSLQDNGFFTAEHTVSLAGGSSKSSEIATPQELDSVIETEKHQILNDAELSKKFDALDKKITRNQELRQFRSYLENNPELIPELMDTDELRRKLWLSYCFVAQAELAEFASTYRSCKDELAQVVEEAKNQKTEWQSVLSIFHSRFSVPFSIEIVNQDEVILEDKVPSLFFTYREGDESREIGRDDLLNVLSTGEKRALYLLNVIFEIQARAKDPENTVLVLDDIADSFDYKNKYAIIEYLKDIVENNPVLMLILTHNFDFFRTVQSRLNIHRQENCLMAMKSDEGVTIERAEYLNPFKHWRKQLGSRRNVMVAMIPMVRNLVEYTGGEESGEFVFLTSLLHVKTDTHKITIGELACVFNSVLGMQISGGSEQVFDVILEEAESCTDEGDSINLENKVVLSIAIRLLAEDFNAWCEL